MQPVAEKDHFVTHFRERWPEFLEIRMDIGRVCIVVGLTLTCCGVALSLIPKGWDLLGWFGHLPGDIYYKSDRTVIWIPITSMLVVSAVLSLASWAAQRFLR